MVLTYDAEAQTLDGAPLKPEGGQVRIQALIDRPCVEVFGNGGRIMTGRALPGVGEVNEMIVRAEGGDARVVSMTVTRLKPFLAAKLVHPPGKPVGVNETKQLNTEHRARLRNKSELCRSCAVL